MKALICSSPGNGSALRIGELPIPQPKSHEIRIKTHFAGSLGKGRRRDRGACRADSLRQDHRPDQAIMIMGEQPQESHPCPWLSHYPRDLQSDERRATGHILDAFKANVNRAPDGEALRYFDASLTFHELDGLSDAFSVWLQEHHVKPGDRVGIILQNVPHFAIAALAAWKGGAIPVPGNPMYKADELARA